jgi:hypothetical protein
MIEFRDKRPELTKNIDIEDFRNFYWLKKELTDFCVRHGIKTTGRKLEIVSRIEKFLTTGIVTENVLVENKTVNNKIMVNASSLSMDTVVTESLKFNEANRAFFKSQIGPHFHFTAHIGKFVRENLKAGNVITFRDLVDEWFAEKERRKDASYKPKEWLHVSIINL